MISPLTSLINSSIKTLIILGVKTTCCACHQFSFLTSSFTLMAHWKAIKKSRGIMWTSASDSAQQWLIMWARNSSGGSSPHMCQYRLYFPRLLSHCCKQMQFPWRHGEPLCGHHGYYRSAQLLWLAESDTELGCCALLVEAAWGGGGGGKQIQSLISVSITRLSAEPDTRFSPCLSHTDTLTDS